MDKTSQKTVLFSKEYLSLGGFVEELMKTINWERIYLPYTSYESQPKKFSKLPKPLPWAEDLEENIQLTLEWLIRDSRKDEIRLSEEPILNLIKDNWYRAEFEEGRFIHICYPEELLKFRTKYESIYNQLIIREYLCNEKTKFDFQYFQLYVNQARSTLWDAWNCFGSDGNKKDPTEIDELCKPGEAWEYLPWSKWPRVWENKCDRCLEPLPKALQMWVHLQYKKLKEANS